MIKAIGTILFGIIALALITDIVVVNYVHDSSGRAIEHSLDAGIVESGIVLDAQAGIVQLEPSSLKAAVQRQFIDSLNLSTSMENKVMKNSRMDLEMTYDGNDIPWIEVVFHTNVSFAIPGVTHDVTVNRKIAYESIYK
ncbi:hypothetical protein AAXB25_33535 [Paenibacillus lautus]|uniref:hypothetical protein n=1 Tax=Paenibacillus lautus TaxID=1401 RepID=UPI003D2B2C15